MGNNSKLPRPKKIIKVSQLPSSKWSLASKMNLIFKVFFTTMFIVVFIVCALAPVVFRTSPTIQKVFVFMNYINFGLSHPEDLGLNCTRNFLVNSTNSIQLGVWHIFPSQRANCQHSSDQWNDSQDWFADEYMVVLYMHGIGGTRSSQHRVSLYKMLSHQLNMHVITFDYRGYADSTNVWPHSEGLVNDTNAVYNWLLQNGVSPKRILLWGHSLGTAVAVRHLSLVKVHPMATVLEAPFTNFREVIISFPLSRLFTFLPYFEYFFVDPLVQNPATNFDSLALLHRVQSPLLILHARDDMIVPFDLGKKLHQVAHQVQPNNVSRPKFHSFDEHKGYGHKNIFLDPELPLIIEQFIKSNL